MTIRFQCDTQNLPCSSYGLVPKPGCQVLVNANMVCDQKGLSGPNPLARLRGTLPVRSLHIVDLGKPAIFT